MQQLLEISKKKIIKVGDVVKGIVLAKEPRRLFVDLGEFGTGVVFGREYLGTQDTIKNLKVGNELSAKVVAPMNEDENWELSLSEADRQAAWQKLHELKDSRTTLTVTITGANYGGLLMQLEGTEGFLPVSQLSLEHYPRVEGGDKIRILEELKKFAGKPIAVRILDIDEKEGKLIFSEREAQQEAIQQAITQYHVGDTVEGDITGIADFGAFIKFGDSFPLEGLIHVSEMDYDLVDDPNKFVKVGERIKVKITNIKDNRIFLSLKALRPDPWDAVTQTFVQEQAYSGTVIKINTLGALVSLGGGIYGVCPPSVFGDDLEKLKENLKPEDRREFTVVSYNQDDKRVIIEPKKA
jgi:small subunit ribosomal protein S1